MDLMKVKTQKNIYAIREMSGVLDAKEIWITTEFNYGRLCILKAVLKKCKRFPMDFLFEETCKLPIQNFI